MRLLTGKSQARNNVAKIRGKSHDWVEECTLWIGIERESRRGLSNLTAVGLR